MVVDLEHLENEIAQIRKNGVQVSPSNLKLSTRATISMPWHRVQDELEEDRLAQSGSAFGSTRRGIAYAYSYAGAAKNHTGIQKSGACRLLPSGTDVLFRTFILVSETGTALCSLYL